MNISRDSTNGLTWFIINHEYATLNPKPLIKHTILMDLTSNGLLIKSHYYDFNDITCNVNISK